MGMYESTCTASDKPTGLDKNVLDEVISRLKDMERNEPIAAYMRERGFDPNKGDVMIVPDFLWRRLGMPDLPYVQKSVFITQILLMKSPMSIIAPMPEFDYTEVKRPFKFGARLRELLRRLFK